MSVTNKQRVAELSELPPGAALRVVVDGVAICLARAESGDVFALLDRCSHEEFALSDGEVVGTEIECPIHLARFDLRSGAPCAQPATMPVRTFPVIVEAEAVYVEL